MSEVEARNYAALQVATPWSEVEPLWRTATSILEKTPPWDGAAPEVKELDADFLDAARVIEQSKLFRQLFNQPRLVSIEIAPLICLQQFVDTEFSDALAADKMTVQQFADYCFPQTISESVGNRFDERSLTLFSLDRNFSFAPPELRPGPEIVFRLLPNANWINVAEFQGRYFLRNGYHRVWRLHQQGHTHVPTILSRARSFAEVAAAPSEFSEARVLSPRPPRFSDFYNAGLAPELSLKSLLLVLRFAADAMILPRLP